jgi:DNA polymerase III epsilon subunit-like protein
MRVTMEYVDNRYKDFAAKYGQLLEFLNYPAPYIAESVAKLSLRLATHDFKRYGDRPINFLHAGKRITRALIRFALEGCPHEKQRRELLRTKYLRKIEEVRRSQPQATFFSFEAVYAKELKVDLSPHRQWFCV